MPTTVTIYNPGKKAREHTIRISIFFFLYSIWEAGKKDDAKTMEKTRAQTKSKEENAFKLTKGKPHTFYVLATCYPHALITSIYAHHQITQTKFRSEPKGH